MFKNKQRNILLFIAQRTRIGLSGRQTCVGVRSGDHALLFTSLIFHALAKSINKRILKRLLGLHGTPNMRGRGVWRSGLLVTRWRCDFTLAKGYVGTGFATPCRQAQRTQCFC